MLAKIKGYKNLSQQYLTEALFQLMEEKEFRTITITEIAKKAEIARRTVYLNFDSKEAIVENYFDLLFEEFLEMFQKEETTDAVAAAKAYFTFWQERLPFIRLLQRNQLIELLINKYSEKLSDLTYFDPTESFGLALTGKELAIFSAFNAAGLGKMLEYWASTDGAESVEEMTAIYEKIVGIKRIK